MDAVTLNDILVQQTNMARNLSSDLSRMQLKQMIDISLQKEGDVYTMRKLTLPVPPSMNTLGQPGTVNVPVGAIVPIPNLEMHKMKVDSHIECHSITRARDAGKPSTFSGKPQHSKRSDIHIEFNLKHQAAPEGILKMNDHLTKKL